ncbi:putative S1/P1 Nuclease [Lyophyllum shimeji]|uniref:S1/P1 Nuclease n=1 Tax=Lyophyllum shimeji TaxID=47721 RepID=A0A9P3PQ51_LYOSH|nr:putative S1/P1 Nuclease [Lyophyllum shimeji]
MRPLHLALLLSAGSVSLPGVLGWGHEIVATIAQIHLHPSVFPTLCSILNYTSPDPTAPPCHLAPIAAWADKVRYHMRWSAPLHYVGALDDHPSQTCAFPGQRGWAGAKGHNVLGAVRNVTGLLEDYVSDAHGSAVRHDAANEALKFLVHFLGDLHMPLHLTGRDRGGNSVKVKFGERVTSLHSLWDGLLIAKAIRETPNNYTRPLPSRQIEHSLRGTIYDSYVRRIMWEGVLSSWKDEIPDWLSCPAPSPPSPSPPPPPPAPSSALTSIWHTLTRLLLPSHLPDTTTPSDETETDDALLCPHAWAAPIHALNCELVWPRALDEPPYTYTSRLPLPLPAFLVRLLPRILPHSFFKPPSMEDETPTHTHTHADTADTADTGLLQLDTPEYAGLIAERRVVEKLLAQAGVRLAATLNWLFADPSASVEMWGPGPGVGVSQQALRMGMSLGVALEGQGQGQGQGR